MFQNAPKQYKNSRMLLEFKPRACTPEDEAPLPTLIYENVKVGEKKYRTNVKERENVTCRL